MDFIMKQDNYASAAATDLSARYRAPTDKRYIFFALIASFLLAISQSIRGAASNDLFETKFALSLTYLVCSALYVIFKKIQARLKNEVFYAPWYTAQLGTFKSIRILLTGTQAENEVFVFNSKIFWIMAFGGVCEFLGSTLMLLSYRAAWVDYINQGICSAMLSVTCITVTISSYCIYRERIHCVQFVGIILILVSICLIVVNSP